MNEDGQFTETQNVRSTGDLVAKNSISVAHDALEQSLVNLQEVIERLEQRVERFMRPDARAEAPSKSVYDGVNPEASREQNMIWNAHRIVGQTTERLRSINDRIDS